ncbi:MAG: hypothetical protein R3C01_16570 [Planctomycetaceae bacterium]
MAHTPKRTFVRRLACLSAGGVLLGAPLLWPNLFNSFGQSGRNVAYAATATPASASMPKSDIQKHLDELYARDGKRAPKMLLPSQQQAMPSSASQSQLIDVVDEGFVTPVASSDGGEPSTFSKILAKFRRSPSAPTEPPQEPNPYRPRTGQPQQLPVQPAGMPQYKELVAPATPEGTPQPQNGQFQQRPRQAQAQQQAQQTAAAGRGRRQQGVQHGQISEVPSQDPVFVFDDQTADRVAGSAIRPGDGDLNTGWNEGPTQPAAVGRPLPGPPQTAEAPWDGLTEPVATNPPAIANPSEHDFFFPDDVANPTQERNQQQTQTTTPAAQPRELDPLLDLSMDDLPRNSSGRPSSTAESTPAVRPETTAESTSPPAITETVPSPEAGVPEIEEETFEDPFTGLKLEARPTSVSQTRTRTLPTPETSVPAPPPLDGFSRPQLPSSDLPSDLIPENELPPTTDSVRQPLVPAPGLGGIEETTDFPETELPSLGIEDSIESTPMEPTFDPADLPSIPTESPAAEISDSVTGGPSFGGPSESRETNPDMEPVGRAQLPLTLPSNEAPPSLTPPQTARQIEVPAAPSPDEVQSKLARIAARKGKVGLKGFCPVVLRDERDLKDALPDFSTVIDGKRYFTSSAEALAHLEAAPEKYTPAASGHDVVHYQLTGQEIEGSLDHASWFQGRLYLFLSAETMETFVSAPSSHAVQ